MHARFFVFAGFLLVGCITTEVPPDAEAVHDLITVGEFDEVDNFRAPDRLNYSYINDYFVSVTEGSRHYLLEFKSRCYNLRRNQYSPLMIDYRRDPTYIWATWDTIRGCSIDKIYVLSDDQFAEVMSLKNG